jgi:UDP-2,3-diacylglucosamine pyrophosphatase LpxH
MEGAMHLHFRTIWISDTHLGGKNLKSKQLLDFLQKTDSDYLYLVGDIFDLWKLRSKWHWPEINDRIVNLVLRKVQDGTKVIYLPGNHDASFKNYNNSALAGIEICEEHIHHTIDDRKYLVLHGDQFDCVVQKSTWLAGVGSVVYEHLLTINRVYNKLRERQGKEYFSISAYLKHRCKKAVNYIGSYEETLAKEVKKKEVDGIICGHIHSASLKSMPGFIYANSGDWVESCTALAENHNGTLGLIEWDEKGFETITTQVKMSEKDSYRDRCLAPTN